MEEEKSPKPGGEPKCIKGAAAGAGGQGRRGRAGGGSGREVWGAVRRGGPPGGERRDAAPTPARTRARTQTLTRSPAPESPARSRRMARAERNQGSCRAAMPEGMLVRRPGRQASGRRKDQAEPSSPRPRPARARLHLTAAGALGPQAVARRPLRRTLARPLPPPPAALPAPPRALRVLFGAAAAELSPPRPPRLALAAPRVVNLQWPRIPPDVGSGCAAPSFFKLCRSRRRGMRGKGAVGGEKTRRGRGGGEVGLKNNNNNKKVIPSSPPSPSLSALGAGPGAGGRPG